MPKYNNKEYAIIVLAGGTASTLDALSSHTVHFDKAYGYQLGNSAKPVAWGSNDARATQETSSTTREVAAGTVKPRPSTYTDASCGSSDEGCYQGSGTTSLAVTYMVDGFHMRGHELATSGGHTASGRPTATTSRHTAARALVQLHGLPSTRPTQRRGPRRGPTAMPTGGTTDVHGQVAYGR